MLSETLYSDVTMLDVLISLIIFSVIILIGKIIIMNLKRSLKDKISKDRLNTLSKIIYYSSIFIGFIAILPILRVDLSGFLVAGGIMAIVIGFASQSIVTNLISGIFLTFERPMRVDDVVEIGGPNGTVGVVEDIRIISTSIRTFDGVYVRIPNEKVFTGNISNYLENIARRFEYTVGIRYSDDAEKAVEIINQLIEEEPMALKNPPPQVFVGNLGSSSVDIQVRIWAPSSEWFQVRMKMLWMIKKTLEENGIQVPFTQQEVWFKNELEHAERGDEKRGRLD